MKHNNGQINFAECFPSPKSGQIILLFFFLIFCAGTILVSCKSKESEPMALKGRILLFYAGDEDGGYYFSPSGYAPGIYELTPDQQSPQLLWENLPVQLLDAYPIISPDGNFALLQGRDPVSKEAEYFLVNLQTGEGHVIPVWWSSFMVFSPDSRYLVSSNGSNLVLINVQKNSLLEMEKASQKGDEEAYLAFEEQSLTLLPDHCTRGINCSVCLPVENPVWLDNETIVVAADSRYLDESFSFPEGSTCGINGKLDMFIVINLDGTFTTNVPAPSEVDLPLINNNPNLINTAIIVRDPLRQMNGWNSYSWIDPNAIADKGKIIKRSIGYINPDLLSVSTDGKMMLWFKQEWELYDLKTRKISQLGKYPDMERIYNCIWSPEGDAVACLGLLRNGNNQLFLLPFSGKNPSTLFTWDNHQINSGWYLLGWQP